MRVNSEVGSVGHRDSRSVRVGAEDSSHGGKRVDDHHHHGVVRFGQSKDKYSSQLFKSCVNLLEKLMKHKFGWVFNVPVDVKGLGLLDYNSIIKHPMDLGTVKSRLLNKTLYKSPIEFADDVRLTFNNAMLYNPKGQDVHSMAEQLLKIFEDRWAAMRSLDRAESVTKPVNPNSVTTTPIPKKPKPMEAVKRDMTYEEKQMLSTNLQNLPSEKLDNVVQIIKKRTPGLSHQEDEIEVDIASLEAETLWELDRFVNSYKRSLMSTNKRKE
uniref:Uncharacterized protein n=1 Tax=Cannabis sativa TaxID=3483 RepID=A0A803QHR8_CANSA